MPTAGEGYIRLAAMEDGRDKRTMGVRGKGGVDRDGATAHPLMVRRTSELLFVRRKLPAVP